MRPLEGLLVVSIEQAVAAPFCTARLAPPRLSLLALPLTSLLRSHGVLEPVGYPGGPQIRAGFPAQ